MKIINLKTGVIFDLPKQDVEALLKASPDIFAKVTKNKKIIKPNKKNVNENSLLSQILED
ncbi:MAG: hypothetical protein K6E29_00785 [Cyanobacteria bacterium RUI128]|nr:hypothetical protein [Cyanobacteria bacterium RUI128]